MNESLQYNPYTKKDDKNYKDNKQNKRKPAADGFVGDDSDYLEAMLRLLPMARSYDCGDDDDDDDIETGGVNKLPRGGDSRFFREKVRTLARLTIRSHLCYVPSMCCLKV